MGMNLSRLDDGELFECSNGMWGIIMASAYKTGWKPLGTFKMDENDNPDPNWDKNDYSSIKSIGLITLPVDLLIFSSSINHQP